MNKTVQAHAALIFVSLVYAFTFSVVKEVIPVYLSAPAFVVLRVAGALLLFWPISAIFIRERVDKKDFPRLLALAILGVAINQSLFFKGLEITTPINASIIMVSNPIFVLIFSALLLKERISLRKIAGISFGIVGALLLLLFNKDFTFGSRTLVGDIMILINSMAWAGYIVLVKPLMNKYNSFTIVKWVFLFGFCCVLPVGYTDLTTVTWSSVTSVIWLDIVFIIIGSTFLSYVLNTYALRALSPSSMSMYVYFQPFLTTLIAILFYHNDWLDMRKIVSGILIIIGVYLVGRPASRVNSNKAD